MNRDEYCFEVTERLRKVISFAWGDKAAEWLASLPQVVDEYSKKWLITPTGVPNSGAMSCCVFCTTSSGQECVLKIPVEAKDGVFEVAVLQRWSEVGVSPSVLKRDEDTGVFLMQRVLPGNNIEPIDDVGALDKAVALCEQMHRVSMNGLKSVESFETHIRMRFEWARERFHMTGNSAGEKLCDLVQPVLENLFHTCDESVLLHGDLQPKNILSNETGEYIVIDPLACYGEAKSDLVFWMCSQRSEQSVEEQLLEVYDPSDKDGYRAFAWAAVFSVIELRPYSDLYSPRMAELLSSSFTAQVLGVPKDSLVALVEEAMTVKTMP